MPLATITSKRQLTIPISVFKKAKFSQSQKVLVTEKSGKLIISPFRELVAKLAGSLEIPKTWKSKDFDEIIEKSKQSYFAKSQAR